MADFTAKNVRPEGQWRPIATAFLTFLILDCFTKPNANNAYSYTITILILPGIFVVWRLLPAWRRLTTVLWIAVFVFLLALNVRVVQPDWVIIGIITVVFSIGTILPDALTWGSIIAGMHDADSSLRVVKYSVDWFGSRDIEATSSIGNWRMSSRFWHATVPNDTPAMQIMLPNGVTMIARRYR